MRRRRRRRGRRRRERRDSKRVKRTWTRRRRSRKRHERNKIVGLMTIETVRDPSSKTRLTLTFLALFWISNLSSNV